MDAVVEGNSILNNRKKHLWLYGLGGTKCSPSEYDLELYYFNITYFGIKVCLTIHAVGQCNISTKGFKQPLKSEFDSLHF